jgi:hypothetical protein
VETLRHESENKSFTEAWWFCGGIIEWYVNWLHLVELWNFVYVRIKALAMLACSCRLLFNCSYCASLLLWGEKLLFSGTSTRVFPSPGKVLGLREIFQIPCPEK